MPGLVGVRVDADPLGRELAPACLTERVEDLAHRVGVRGDGCLGGRPTRLGTEGHLGLVRNRVDGADAGDRDRVLRGSGVLRAGEVGKPDGAGERDDGEPGGSEKKQAFHRENLRLMGDEASTPPARRLVTPEALDVLSSPLS